jgi:hypothetical protein
MLVNTTRCVWRMLATAETATVQMESFHPWNWRSLWTWQAYNCQFGKRIPTIQHSSNFRLSRRWMWRVWPPGLLRCVDRREPDFRKNTSSTYSGLKSQALSELHDATNQETLFFNSALSQATMYGQMKNKISSCVMEQILRFAKLERDLASRILCKQTEY